MPSRRSGKRLQLDLLKRQLVVRTGNGRRGCLVELTVRDAEDVLRTDPRTVLERAGLLMGQIALVCGQRTAQEAVACAGLSDAVVQDGAEVRNDGRRIGDGGGVCDSARDVADAVVHNALLDVARILVGGLVEGLDRAVVIVRNIDDNAALLHEPQHLAVDEEVMTALRPLDAVEDHIGLRQQSGDILLGAEHGVDALLILALGGAQQADVDVHEGNVSAERVQNGQSRLTDRAAAQDEDIHRRSAAEAADELALAAGDGQHGLQTEQSALLAGRLAVRGAVAVAVLCGEGDALAVEDGLKLLRVRRRMDAGEDDLTLAQQRELARLQLLDLGHEVALCVDLLHGIDQLRAGLLIRLVSEAGRGASAALHERRMTVRNDGRDFSRSRNGAVFSVLDVLQQSENQ